MASDDNTTNGSTTTQKTEGNGAAPPEKGNGALDLAGLVLDQMSVEEVLPPGAVEAEIERLAKLPPLGFEREMRASAERFGVALLRKLVTRARAELARGEPESLAPPLGEEEPYPIDALPEPVANAVAEYQFFGQQPTSLIAGSALAVTSLACQAHANVARDAQHRGPISLNEMTIAVSGEGKTTADHYFMRQASEWLLDQRRQRPKDERELFLFYQDATPERLVTALFERWPSAGLFSDEAAVVIGSYAVIETAQRFFGLLNRLWDGSPFSRERQTSGSVYLVGRRFTAHLMMQPVVFQDLLAVGDGLARAVGLLSRFLIVRPRSTLGERVYREAPTKTPALDRYNARVVELLENQLTNPHVIPGDLTCALKPPLLTLSPRAKECWVDYYNDVMGQVGERGRYAEIADVAAKSPENVARLAGIHHIFEGGAAPGEITDEVMQKAVRLGRWYLDETRRALGVGERSQVYADAELLIAWAVKCAPGGFPAREVLRAAPARLRQVPRRDAALDLLVETGHLQRTLRLGAAYFSVNPQLKAASH